MNSAFSHVRSVLNLGNLHPKFHLEARAFNRLGAIDSEPLCSFFGICLVCAE
jgi:hypothetical protein